MSDLDKNIREALAAEEAELLGHFDEPPLSEQVIESFRGKNRWLVVLMFVGTTAFVVIAVVTALQFFRAEGIREMIAWAGGFGFSLIAIAMMKIWYWMELNKNAVTREVKRVELQIARLASQLKKPE